LRKLSTSINLLALTLYKTSAMIVRGCILRSLASAIRIKPPVNATAVGIVDRVKRARGPPLKSVVLLAF
jgi:hypothetical protein